MLVGMCKYLINPKRKPSKHKQEKAGDDKRPDKSSQCSQLIWCVSA